ncbi:MAG: anti-sigma factor [Acidimicrobiia bacterium]|nr:anti-sigma factor [Acidimicrobiia bacterium]
MTAGSYRSSGESDFDIDGLEDEFRRLASEITDADRERLILPSTLWPTIAEAMSPADSPTVRSARTAPGRWVGLTRTNLALAAAVLVAVIGAAGLADRAGVFGADVGQPLAQASIGNTGLEVAFDGSGHAALRTSDSRFEMELQLPPLPAQYGAYYELWMIDPDLDGMVSLGPVVVNDGEDARHTRTIVIPDTVDYRRYPVVDLSVEPIDGDPTHSGRSILRGSLVPSGGT